ncbi:MAG: hypothetical protein MUF25_11975 [Pirellulaceae bacterium]|jgi:hypothetical protein|nr:hypothetical protein [Pirellulaceae bacterium]
MNPPRIRRSIVRSGRYGWAISLLVHGALAAGLAAWTFQPWWLANGAAGNARRIQLAMAASEAAEQATPEVRIVSDPAEVTAELVRNRLEAVVADAESLSEADKLARLDALSERLTQVADEGSIQALSGVMQSFLGTQSRATQPAEEKPPGEFDFETAQFHDIQRTPKEPDGFRYVTVLLDAEGRTLEVEVSEQEGKPIYETMQRIKANPLLDQVYRQIVMPLLDQLTAGVKQAQAGKVEAGP